MKSPRGREVRLRWKPLPAPWVLTDKYEMKEDSSTSVKANSVDEPSLVLLLKKANNIINFVLPCVYQFKLHPAPPISFTYKHKAPFNFTQTSNKSSSSFPLRTCKPYTKCHWVNPGVNIWSASSAWANTFINIIVTFFAIYQLVKSHNF